MNKRMQTFLFTLPTTIEASWMIGSTSLGVYNSIFNTTTKNINFEFYTDNFEELSFTELKDELEKILDI